MRRRRKKITPLYRKVVARIELESYNRLSAIKDKYGFSSNYEIVQYLVACFLRVADPEHVDSEDNEPIPDEITAMFEDFSRSEKHFEFVKPKRKLPQYELNKINGQLSIWQD